MQDAQNFARYCCVEVNLKAENLGLVLLHILKGVQLKNRSC